MSAAGQKRPRIHLLHGIHTSEGNNTVAQLIPYLRHGTGLEVVQHRYGYALALTARWLNPGRAKKIAREIAPGDICVGHSNGACLIWLMASRYQAPIGGAVLLNPALDVDARFPPGVDFVHVYYNRGDEWVGWADYLGGGHPWGPMGRDGPNYEAPGLIKIDTDHGQHAHPVLGHGEILDPKALEYWGEFIPARIREARGLPSPVCRVMAEEPTS